MARPGFYNDNEYRAYPFVYNDAAVGLPTAAVVDAGFIMGLDCNFDSAQHRIWLHAARVADETVELEFKTDAHETALIFSFPAAVEEWTTVYAETAPADEECAEEPVWSGFIVVGLLTDVTAATFSETAYVIEPGRVQNLAKSYVRSINVGNYSRIAVPPCGGTGTTTLDERSIVANATCLTGHIRFEEGYNCRITQVDRTNTILFAPERGAGKKEDQELCENGGEVPITTNEQKPIGSLFYSGGPACKDLIFTINGVGGKNVNFIGGKNVIIGTGVEPNAIKVTLNDNIQGGCNE